MKDNEPKVILSPDVEDKMAKDSKLAEALREFSALARQAMLGVETGQYKSFEHGMEILTGYKPMEMWFEDEEE